MDKTLWLIQGTHVRFVVLSKESNKIDLVNKKTSIHRGFRNF